MSGKKNIFSSYTINKTFIETGSYYGDGIQRALDTGFERIISIELTPKYYELCVERFKDNKKVELHLGDSVSLLPSIIASVEGGITFWLDAHFTDPTTLFKDKWCPLMEELEVIVPHTEKNSDIILISDLRIWEQERYAFNFQDLKDSLMKSKAMNIEFMFDEGYLPNDVLVAKFEVCPAEPVATLDVMIQEELKIDVENLGGVTPESIDALVEAVNCEIEAPVLKPSAKLETPTSYKPHSKSEFRRIEIQKEAAKEKNKKTKKDTNKKTKK